MEAAKGYFQALEEIRFEFEAAHKKLRYMVNEFSYYEEREKMNSRVKWQIDSCPNYLKPLELKTMLRGTFLRKWTLIKDSYQVYEDIKTAIRDSCGEAAKARQCEPCQALAGKKVWRSKTTVTKKQI